ncbi:hypothetical protein EK0264_15665 [Epidermidibacterium keratini]|uniref:TPM domain-containing protein n=1 Tax=Epidermidibacterium keratini TaxID=1891644 RepID=A0A7L4YSS5_9ACTN|nr:hypothetical protein [Epidermidibacterium keratini]QHC01587.1 hypothetical protein EK0264_15665 [Epidermidibacterium keratini]
MTFELPRFRRRALALLAALAACLLALATPAYAEGDPGTEADAAGADFQQGTHVYVSPNAAQDVDVDALSSDIGDDPIYIAVVPPNTPPSDVAMQISTTFQQKMTLVVVSGSEYVGQSNAICSDRAQPLLDDAAGNYQDERASGDLTGWLREYVAAVQDAPSSGDSACEGGASASGGGIGSSLLWILGALVVGAGGGYLWMRSQRAKRDREMESAGAGIRELTDDLGTAIEGTSADSNELAAAALHDARERHAASKDTLAQAEDTDDVAAARQATIEGLTAVRYARQAQGQRVDFTVPELPRPAGEQLEHEQEFAVGDQRAVGVPNYAPGAPYYHPGGDDIPGGWYSAPIWDSVLIDSIVDDESDGGIWDEQDDPDRR